MDPTELLGQFDRNWTFLTCVFTRCANRAETSAHFFADARQVFMTIPPKFALIG
jgi:hypothetical protein